MEQQNKELENLLLKQIIAKTKAKADLEALALAVEMWCSEEVKAAILQEFKYLTQSENNPVKNALNALSTINDSALPKITHK